MNQKGSTRWFKTMVQSKSEHSKRSFADRESHSDEQGNLGPKKKKPSNICAQIQTKISANTSFVWGRAGAKL